MVMMVVLRTQDASVVILQPLGCEQSAELSGLHVASLSAVDVKQSSRLSQTWPFYGARLLLSFNVLPNCKFSNLPVHPRVVPYGLYVGLLWLFFFFFKDNDGYDVDDFALASWMHIVFLLKPYSSLWDFEGFAHVVTWNLVFATKMSFGTKIQTSLKVFS